MKKLISSCLRSPLTTAIALAAMGLVHNPIQAPAKGGAGGGGSKATAPAKVKESRVTGYVTAIDYVNSSVQIGDSYYGSGLLYVDSNTAISLDNVSCSFVDLQMGDWVEARYLFVKDPVTGATIRLATKLSAGSSSSI